MATHSGVLAWRIPRTEEPSRLHSRVAKSWTGAKQRNTLTGPGSKVAVWGTATRRQHFFSPSLVSDAQPSGRARSELWWDRSHSRHSRASVPFLLLHYTSPPSPEQITVPAGLLCCGLGSLKAMLALCRAAQSRGRKPSAKKRGGQVTFQSPSGPESPPSFGCIGLDWLLEVRPDVEIASLMGYRPQAHKESDMMKAT